MNRSSRFARAITNSPLLWGSLGAVAFYTLIHAGPLDMPLVTRYFTHHPVEYMETVLFSIGLAALILKAFDVAAQRVGLQSPLLGPANKTADPVGECNTLLARLDRLPGRRQGEYYVARLRTALEHVRRRGSAESLDDELKYLSDLDAARQHSSYALFRVIVWAIPILGFLGTVIGITMALNGVDLQAPDKSMLEVLNGLGLKFDTTALALTLAIVLMFAHYCVERVETSLVEQVDRRVEEELSGRFAVTSSGIEGQVAALQRISEMTFRSTEALMKRQAEMWQAAVDSAARGWSQMSKTASEQTHSALVAAAGELAAKTDVLGRAVEAAGEVTKLESSLNRNLAALAGAKHFEQTVLSLAAAVNMLGARLTESNGSSEPVHLEPTRRSVHAA